DRFTAIVDVEFLEDVVEVRLDRWGSQHQILCHSLRRVSFRHCAKHLHLARSQVHIGMGWKWCCLDYTSNDVRHHPPRHRLLISQGCKQSSPQLGRTSVLQDVTRTASLHHSKEIITSFRYSPCN